MALFETRGRHWSSGFDLPVDLVLNIHGTNFHLHKIKLAAKSAIISHLLPPKHRGIFYHSFPDVPGDSNTFQLAVNFCYGHTLELTAQNVVPLHSIATYLEMTEQHSPRNLLKITESFFHTTVLSNWNDTVQALKTCEASPHIASTLDLIGKCLVSIVEKAFNDPTLLNPATLFPETDPHSRNPDRKTAKRKLFNTDWSYEDLTSLDLAFYSLVISEMIKQGVSPEHIACSIFRYVKKNPQREILETVERLLPEKKAVLPSKLLFDLLRTAIVLEASNDCKYGLEVRIGNQLEEAVLEDLMIPSWGYTQETQYDIDSIRRILMVFYENSSIPGLSSTAILEFLAEIAGDPNLRISDFISLAEIMKIEFSGCSDDLYRAIDVYLNAHGFLTESEKEEVCQILDCRKLSPEAIQHAGKNERLPLRLVLHVLYIGQLQLREVVAGYKPEGMVMRSPENGVGGDEEMMRLAMERMGDRVMELEKESSRIKEEIGRKRRKKDGFFKGFRKFGCMPSLQACRESKVHPIKK